VPADVLTQHEQLAGRAVEEGGGVKTARLLEDVLPLAQPVGERREQGRVDLERVVQHGVLRLRPDGVDRGLAAQPARAGRVEGALEAGVGGGHPGREGDVEHVVGVEALGRGARTVARREVLVAGRDHALGDEEPRGEIEVVPGGAHGDREGSPAHADLEGLLDGQGVHRPSDGGRPVVVDGEPGHGLP
jgi:hypothetical protein